jgi:hypothetical protein
LRLDFDLQPVERPGTTGFHEDLAEAEKPSGRTEPGKIQVGIGTTLKGCSGRAYRAA